MVYKDCNIGSAKPDEKTLKKYPHHLISLKSLDNVFTVSDFCECANKLIIEAHKNGKLPVLVGGSMMYFKSLFDGIHDLPDRDEEYREELKNSYGLKSVMPQGWEWGYDTFDRYKKAGIEISNRMLLVEGSICR